MSSTSEKLWQTLFSGIVLANATSASVFGQQPQPVPSTAWQQPVHSVAMPQQAVDGVGNQYGAMPTWSPSQQPEGWGHSNSMSAGYCPPNGCQQCMSPPTCQYDSSPMYQCSPCYRPFSGLTARIKCGFERCCHPLRSHRWTETEYDCPAAPLGAALADHRNLVRGEAYYSGMVLYRYDFVDGSDQLNRKGRERLAEIGPLLATTTYPLTIEDLPEEPTLATLRRERVVLELQQRAYGVSPERVIVRSATWPQLRGEEAELIRRRLLKQTTNGAPGTIGSTSSASRSTR